MVVAQPADIKAGPRLSVGFSDSVQRRLADLAERHDRSAAYIVRKAVSFYLDRADTAQLALDLGDERDR